MDLTELGFGGKNSRAVGSGLFIAKLVIQLLSHKLLPFVVPKPALMTMNDSTTGHAVIKRLTDAHGRVASIWLGAIALLFVAWVLSAPGVWALVKMPALAPLLR